MKKGIHPDYREVVFKDVASDFEVIVRSTVPTNQTIEKDGKEYPLYKTDISSASHPFYTGKQRVLDSEGRVEKFRKKFGTSYTKKKK
ncbi:MAG: type B 50S ribosomal protein L31 [Bacteriovoracaceae bacterium]|jgi:large subunit ribosomal protein L31|nr:type B 50S ribosomal protein L31 [Bacteriovoracaceae bacterium]